jgi:hypothetical protein
LTDTQDVLFVSMIVDPELTEMATEARRRLEAGAPEQNLAAATLLRDTKPLLKTKRQREIAEELALDFEKQAASRS